MVLQTKLFGEVDIDENKGLHFENGLIGFPDLKNFFLIRDEERASALICWLQSVEESAMAIPVMNPLKVMETYNPMVDDELLKPLGELTEDNLMALVTVTVPREIEKISVNLQAPILINADTKQACQLILEDKTYPVRYPVYEIINQMKEKDGE
jgi:flagellar assembly factor FliW